MMELNYDYEAMCTPLHVSQSKGLIVINTFVLLVFWGGGLPTVASRGIVVAE